jgi:hypothetical protein
MSDEKTTLRRDFLGQIAASAIVLAGTACASPAATATQSAPAPAGPSANPQSNGRGVGPLPQPPSTWDDSWFGKLTAKHKAVFDSPEINDGLVLSNASGYIRGMRDAIGAGENDVQTAIVLRHVAVVMFLNDAMWSKYELGKLRNVKDEGTEKWATKNPFAGALTSRPAAGTADRPQATLNWFASRGHIILGCDLATRNLSGVLARQVKGESRAVYEELKANMIAGVILQPTGVYACLRAQEAGCGFFKST